MYRRKGIGKFLRWDDKASPLHGSLTNDQLLILFGQWLTSQEYAIASQREYTRTAEWFCEFLNAKALARASPMDIHKFLAHIDKPSYKDSYVANRITALRCFFDFLCLAGIVENAAPRLVRARNRLRRLPRVLSFLNIRKLIASSENARERAILEMLYATGCRISELAAVDLADIDFKRKEIRVIGKRRERMVYFHNAAKRAVLEYLKGRTRGPLFVNDYSRRQKGYISHIGSRWYGVWNEHRQGRPRIRHCQLLGIWADSIATARGKAKAEFVRLLKGENLKAPLHALTSFTLGKTVRDVAARAGFENITPRMFRSSFATHLLDSGADIRSVQALLGHSYLASIEPYLSVSDRRVAADYKQYHPLK
jgi:site-specific recombinase XerD